jgi:hypothetical protein
MPEHDESHVGPYGVEVPLQWDFVVKVTEVTVAVKVDAEKGNCSGPCHVGNGSNEVGIQPKQG